MANKIRSIMSIRLLRFLLVLVLIIQGCRSAADLSSVKPNSKWSTAQVIRAHNQTKPEFTYVAARGQVVYKTDKQEQKINISLRMKRGDTIWMKATVFGITLAKALITKEQVSYYEMINKTYYKGPVSQLSKWIGVTVTLEQLQNILLGQSVLAMERRVPKEMSIDTYVLGPVETEIDWNLFNAIRPDNFRLKSAQVASKGIVPTDVSLNYGNYMEVAEQYFPEQLNLSVTAPRTKTDIKLTFRKFDLLDRLNFGFAVPQGFKQITP